MVVRSLFNLCIDAIQDLLRAGIQVNLDDLPVDLRQMIFLRFPSYSCTKYRTVEDLPASLRRSEFFNHFEHIVLLNFRDCDQHKILMSTILAEIERPGSSLASTLVSLKLRVCFVDRRPQYSICQRLGLWEKPKFDADIYRLIEACRNVRRLFLAKCSTCWDGPDYPMTGTQETSSRNCGYVLDEIMDALRTVGATRAPLEELTLYKLSAWSFGTRFLAPATLQALRLRQCVLSPAEFLRLIEPCRKTLVTLSLEDTMINEYHFDRPLDLRIYRQRTADVNTDCQPGISSFVDLPALTSLTINESHWYSGYFTHTIKWCLLSSETLRRLRHGKVCLYDTSNDETIQLLADCLPTEVEVAFVFGDSLDFQRFSFAYSLFGRRIVELHIKSDKARFPRQEDYGRVVDQLTSIRVLVMSAVFDHDENFRGDRFLRLFLSDARRGAQLRRLEIFWDLQAETLQLLFRHCFNLKRLCVCSHSGYWDDLPAITDEHLKIWAANGAKPKQIDFGYNLNITADGVEHLLRNCDGELKAPRFLDERGRFINKLVEFH